MLRFEPGISEQLSSGWALGWVKPDAANDKGSCGVLGLVVIIIIFNYNLIILYYYDYNMLVL